MGLFQPIHPWTLIWIPLHPTAQRAFRENEIRRRPSAPRSIRPPHRSRNAGATPPAACPLRSAPMRALTRSASLLRRAARSTPTTAALHQPAPGGGAFLAKGSWKHSLARENTTFVTAAHLNVAILDFKTKSEKSLSDLNHKFKKSFMEYKISSNMAMQQIKCDLRKEVSDKHNKHYLDHVGSTNDLKILGQRFETHKMNISHMLTQGIITFMKNFGWGFGASTAAARLSSLSKVLFKTNGKE